MVRFYLYSNNGFNKAWYKYIIGKVKRRLIPYACIESVIDIKWISSERNLLTDPKKVIYEIRRKTLKEPEKVFYCIFTGFNKR